MNLSQRLANLSPKQRAALQARLQSQSAPPEPIAVVGMSCRFPGAPNLDAYWELISGGIDGTSDIPLDRFDIDALYDPSGQTAGKMSVRRAGLVSGIDQFDPQFFGISPREAARMDPQQRLLLEVAWESLEIGGIDARQIADTDASMFVGIGGTDYSKLPSQYNGYYKYIDAHVGTGNALSIAANRVSYIMDLHGPSMAIDTACSSSTMATHLAVQSLRRGECSLAIAGGVNAILTPETTIAFSKAQMLSPDGCCRPFDQAANGYVRGEGCGLVVLKRLTDAVAADDLIFGVIRATATNQDGRTSGITAPNGLSQQAVIRSALKQAGITPSRVDYIEAHGTGTPLGDPIEVDALTKVFGPKQTDDKPLYVTSVKANVGHMETVSGVAGMIKVMLMMRHRHIAPQLHLKSLNDKIKLGGSRIVIPDRSPPWPANDDRPLVAGVSSFGFGGSNTHVILEAPANASVTPAESRSPRLWHALTLSAKTLPALRDVVSQLRSYSADHGDDDPADVAMTLNAGRAAMPARASITFDDRETMLKQLDVLETSLESDSKRTPAGIFRGDVSGARAPKVAMMFTGQGSQRIRMGASLMESQPVFADAMHRCESILDPLLPQPLSRVLFPDGGDKDDPDAPLHQTRYTQPALFAIEYALFELWSSLGIRPSYVLGHSVGEYVAMTVAKCVSLEDGLRLIVARAEGMQALPTGDQADAGRMVVVMTNESNVAPLIRASAAVGPIAIAAANGPENTTVSGSVDAIKDFCHRCDEAKLAFQPLRVSHAFHSPLMQPMIDRFRDVAGKCRFEKPKIPLIGNADGRIWKRAPDVDDLCNHILGTVRFADSIATLQQQPIAAVLEVGPAPVLIGMAKRCWSADDSPAWTSSLRPNQHDDQAIANAAATLHVAGLPIDWRAWDRGRGRRRLVLPTYPFQRIRCWLDPSDEISGDSHRRAGDRETTDGAGVPHPMLGRRQRSATMAGLFDSHWSLSRLSYLADHAVQGSVNLPAAGFLEIALAAGSNVIDEKAFEIRDLNVLEPMFLSTERHRRLQTVVGGNREIEIFSQVISDATAGQTETWQRHVHARLLEIDDDEVPPLPESVRDVTTRLISDLSHEAFYGVMSDRQLDYGPIFRMLSRLGSAPSEAIGFVNCDDSVTSSIDDYCWHPVLGDAIFQSFSGLVPREADGGFSPQTYMPTSIKRFRLLRPIDANTIADGLRVYGVRTSPGDVISPETVTGDLWVIDAADQVVAFAQQVTCSRLGRLRRSAEETLSDAIYDVAWQPLDQLANRNGSLGTVGVLTSPHQTNDVEPIRLALAQSGVEVRTVDESDLSVIDDLDLILDARAIGPIDDDAVATTAMDRCESLLTLLQSLTRRVAAPRGGVVVLTQDAQSVLATDRLSGFLASPLASMVRVAQSEMPDVPIRVIDLPCDWESSTVSLADALSAPKSEFQLAIRASDVYAARLHSKQNNAPESASSDPDSTGGRTLSIPASSYRLRFADAGQLDSLHYEAHELPDPDSDQVQLKIHAAGLNFSDVLKVMGLYPGITDPVVPLGIECSGVVTKVGPEVTRFKEGDEVLGVAPFAFASHANTPAYTLVHRPTLMGVTEAASIPIAFLTAWHGLVRLADTQPGERVLIHAGAGGVGLAAIQIAKMLGAEVFATAGSPSKRDFITSMGADHVFDSRSLAFADEIQRQTKGEGIDVVLNSLPGEAIPKSLSCLRAYGRFLEIGKTDIYQNRSIGMLPFQDNLSFHAIDLDRVLRQRPKTIESLYREVMAKFESGELEPTHHKIFEAINVIDAFRYMSARKNIGKVLVQMAAPGATAGEVTSEGVDDAIGTALITGGTGAIGLKLANDLIDRGHTHVALLSRRGIDPTPAIPGGRVCVLKGDVADPDSLDSALGRLPEDFPAITDVYHAAGVLDDGSMMEMTSTKLRKPMSSKIQGTWNLHSWSRKRDLRRFVLFSSIASTLGSPGQSNYAAANGFMDALARHRRVQGLPATSIAWGPWADAGMATGDAQDANLKSRGLSSLSPDQSFELMHELINNDVANVAVVKADWGKLLSLSPKVPYFELIAKQSQNGDQTIAADLAFLDQLSGMDDVSHRQAVEGYFSNELARLMGWDVKQIDQTQPLGDIGMDSLIAMEFKLNLEKRLQVSIPMAALAESPSIESLVGSIWESLPRKSSDGNATQSSDDGYRSLMMLREGEEGGPTWVLVHPLGGSVACYETLVGKAPKSVRCIGVIGRGADGSLDPHADLDAMMDEYVSELVAADLPNDLQLIGWSAGGLFALELMRRLQQTDWSQSRTLTLSLIDTPTPAVYDSVDPDDSVSFLVDFVRFSNVFRNADMRITESQLRKMNHDEQRYQAFLDEAKRNQLILPNASVDFVRRLVATCQAHVRFIEAIDMTRLPDARVFYAADDSALVQASNQKLGTQLGWADFWQRDKTKPPNWQWLQTDGDHFTMLLGDIAKELGSRLG